jgi:hypothetical protein
MVMSENVDPSNTVREVVGVFHSGNSLEAAVEKLEAVGFAREDISVLASHKAVAAHLDNHFETIEQMADDPRVPQAAFVAKSDLAEAKAAVVAVPLYIGATVGTIAVVASGGALALAIAAAAAGGLAGGGLGALAAHAISESHAKAIEKQVAAGGLLLWVRIGDASQEAKAIEIMEASGGEHVRAHDIAKTWGDKDVPLHDWQPDPLLGKD